MAVPRILLVNPPIYDFAAYDFWIKPYGMLSVAGQLRGRAEFVLFDHLDRRRFPKAGRPVLHCDRCGRGEILWHYAERPACLESVPRYFRRFGLSRELFHKCLTQQGPFDYVLIQTVMTYWYLGVREAVEDIRQWAPGARIVLGGNYATLCPGHAGTLGADLCIIGTDLDPLWHLLEITPDPNQPALWESYGQTDVGVLKLSDGCPFHCTYCSVPAVYGGFKPRSLDRVGAELDLLVRLGARNVAFYDDALLFNAETVLIPFLERAIGRSLTVNFHTPNALNARFVTKELSGSMVRAGFKTFYLGFESQSRQWQQGTGGKVYSEELAAAVQHLLDAGANASDMTAYQILGHPDSDVQELEASMYFVHNLGIRGMLADFSPIPGTPDGEACRRWIDLDEPLLHNNTAFPIFRLGFDETNRLKDLQRQLNRTLATV
jgi:hypothetical protein